MGKEQDLLEAARTGKVEVIEKILSQKSKRSGPLALAPLASLRRTANPSCQDGNGYTPLHHAALNGHKEAVQMLLKFEASANIIDNKGCYPLHLAAWNGNASICACLLTQGPSIAKVNETNNDHETALHCAAQYGHSQVVSVLLEHHADPFIRNFREESPLDLASQYGRLETVELLLRKHPIAEYDKHLKHSPLHLASRNGHKQVVKALLDAGFEINKHTEIGTALHEAAVFGKQDVVRLLLDYGIDAELPGTAGKTALQVLGDHTSQTACDIRKIIKDGDGDEADALYDHIREKEKQTRRFLDIDTSSESSSLHNSTRDSTSSGQLYDNVPLPRPITRYSGDSLSSTSDPELLALYAQPEKVLGRKDRALGHSHSTNSSHSYIPPLPPRDNSVFDEPIYDTPIPVIPVCRDSPRSSDSSLSGILAPSAAMNQVSTSLPNDSLRPGLNTKSPETPKKPPRKKFLSKSPRSLDCDVSEMSKVGAADQKEIKEAFNNFSTEEKSGRSSTGEEKRTSQSKTAQKSEKLENGVIREKSEKRLSGGETKKVEMQEKGKEMIPKSKENTPHMEKFQRDEKEKHSPRTINTEHVVMRHPKPAKDASKNSSVVRRESGRSSRMGLVRKESDRTVDRETSIIGGSHSAPRKEQDTKSSVLHSGTKKEVDTRVSSHSGAKKEVDSRVISHSGAKKEVDTRVISHSGAKKEVDTRVKSHSGGKKTVQSKSVSSGSSREVDTKLIENSDGDRGSEGRGGREVADGGYAGARQLAAQAAAETITAEAQRLQEAPVSSWRTLNSSDRQEPTGDSITSTVKSTVPSDGVTDRTSRASTTMSDRTTPSSSRPPSLELGGSRRASREVPLSPTGYEQPPTPDHPPPSPQTAGISIQEKLNPKEKRRSRDMETITESEFLDPFLNDVVMIPDKPTQTADEQTETDPIDGSTDTDMSQYPRLPPEGSDGQSPKQERRAAEVEEVLNNNNNGNGCSPFIGLFRGSIPTGQRRVKSQIYENLIIGPGSKQKHHRRISAPGICMHFDPVMEREEREEKELSVIAGTQEVANPRTSTPQQTTDRARASPSLKQTVTAAESKPPAHTSSMAQKDNLDVREDGREESSPLDENEEWAKIAAIMSTYGGRMSACEYSDYTDFERRLQAIFAEEKGGKKIQSVGDWLEGLGLPQYENTLVANGFDDMDFVGPDILEEQDLVDMGISNEEHRKKIIESSKKLVPMKTLGESQMPGSVDEWLKNLHLSEYIDTFHSNHFTCMARVRKLWELELNSVLDISTVGHRKRILASLTQNPGDNKPLTNDNLDFMDTLKKSLSTLPEAKPGDESSSHTSNSNTHRATVDNMDINLFKDYTKVKPSCLEEAEEFTVNQYVTDLQGKVEVVDNRLQIRPPHLAHTESPVKNWRHQPEVLIKGCCNYSAQYLGSTLVKELNGTDSTKESIIKMKKSTESMLKVPIIILSISYKGVKFIDAKSRKVICEHEIGNIFCACQDGESLNFFAYITKDLQSGRHYCHVFSVRTMDLATEIILTLGEAFEVAYQLALKEAQESGAWEDVDPDGSRLTLEHLNLSREDMGSRPTSMADRQHSDC